MPRNSALNKAARAKKDEFYTQLSDIEKELRHYKAFFKGKVVFCNCDDPYESNFFKYFAMNFNVLGIKKLIVTSYAGSPITGNELEFYVNEVGEISFRPNKPALEISPSKKAYKVEINEVNDENGDGRVDLADVEYLIRNKKNTLSLLEGNGDFRSAECIELLKQADVVVTNPPFSLFREYVAQLMEYEKAFIIIGNQNAITYKEIFPLFQNNRLWLGYGFNGNVAFFNSPYDDYAVSSQHKEGLIRVSGVMWFTNIDVDKRHEDIILYRTYTPNDYPHYDNYDAIEVSKTADIPCDYFGVMGVPITFMDKYNPDQFEIIGCTESEGKGFSNGLWNSKSGVAQPLVNGKRLYKRIFIRRKQVQHEY